MSFMNQIAFNAVVSDVFDKNGKRIDPNIARGVYRDDTEELLSICGPTFKPVQHREVLEPLFERLDKQGMSLEVRSNASRNALYDLAGKKGAFVDVEVTDNGAVMRTKITTGDFIQPTGASQYLESGPDTMLAVYDTVNSHNGKLAARSNCSYNRLICMNGIVRPAFTAKAYGKHTTNFNVDAFMAQVSAQVEAMAADPDLFGKYATTPCNVKQAEVFLQKTFAKLPNKANGDPHFSERLVVEILALFAREDQTVWGLVQALTAWSTHGDMRKNADPVLGRLGREEKVAKTMRSSLFDKLVNEGATA